MVAEMAENTKPVSVQVAMPAEQGGSIARRGFSYQDEVATAFLIKMLENASIESVQCETLDDIVLLRNTAAGRVAEFVQVKSGNSAPTSVANLCASREGSSILEKSLSRDCIGELAWFRIVTSKDVASDLECLTDRRESRRENNPAFIKLVERLEGRLPDARSPNRNDLTYWSHNCLWDVRATQVDIRNANHVTLNKLIADRNQTLNANGIETLLDELRHMARVAATALLDTDLRKKTISRLKLTDWFDRRTLELVSLTQLVAHSDIETRIVPIAAKIAASKEPVDKKAFHYLKRSLRWNYIVEGADSMRSLHSEVLPLLLESVPGPRLFCILGEPLSGKSTFMWRLGYDLYLKGKNVLQVSEPDKSLWRQLGALMEQSKQEVILLVDDLFEDGENIRSIGRFFETAININSQVTVVATVISDNVANRAISDLKREGLFVWHESLTLTLEDKTTFSEGASYDRAAHTVLNAEKLERIDQFHTLAATLRELDEGTLRESDLDAGFVPETLEALRLERLRTHQPRLWAAYKYVAFCNRLKIAIPQPILTRLEDFRFYDIENLDGAESYLSFFSSFAAGEGVTTLGHPVVACQHWKLAETHWRIYTQFESGSAILRAVLETANAENSWHGGFVTHFCRAAVNDPSIPLREIIPDYLEKLRKMRRLLPVEHLVIWKNMYEKFELVDEAQRCDQEAKQQKPADATDAVVQIAIFERQENDIQKAFDAIKRARARWAGNKNIQELFITFVARHHNKFPGDVRALLDDLDTFLKDAGEHWNKVAAYIENIVVPYGQSSHHRRAAKAVWAWLHANPDRASASSLWITYLSLVKKKLPSELAKVCTNCHEWLSAHRTHSGYVHVAHAFGSLMAKSDDKHAIDAALLELSGWLENHPLNGHIWICCLQLSCNRLVNKQYVDNTTMKLMGNPDNDASGESGILNQIDSANIIVDLVEVFKTRYRRADNLIEPEKLNFLFTSVSEWLDIYSEDCHARKCFICFVRDFGTDKQAATLIRKTDQWLISHPDDRGVAKACRTLEGYARRHAR